MSLSLLISALDTTAAAMDRAAESSRQLASARRELADANTHAANALSALGREADPFGGDAIVPDANAIKSGKGGGNPHSGGYITAAYAEQLVGTYAALMAVMETPNVSPFAYNEANRGRQNLAMYWQLLGFLKYGSIESLARAKMRGASKAATSTRPPGTAPTSDRNTISAGRSTGLLP